MSICRFCLKLSPEDSCKNTTSINEEQFQLILPEIVLTAVESSVICDPCAILLDNAYTFKICCLESEKLINDYRDVHGTVNLIEIHEGNIDLNDNLDKKSDLHIEDSVVKAEVGENDVYKSNIDNDDNYDGFNDSAGEEDSAECLENLDIKQELVNKKKTGSTVRKSKKLQELSNTSHNCQKCSASFKNPYSLQRHQWIHITEKKFSCSDCNKKFTTSWYLKDHVKRCHSPASKLKKFECKPCNKTFLEAFRLKRHHAEVHCEKNFKCNHCTLSFSAQRYLESHIERQHNTVETNSEELESKKKYKCEQCAIRFSAHSFLQAHINRKHKIKQELKFNCPRCNLVFTTIQLLQTHLKEQYDKSFADLTLCKFCARPFENPCKLRDHEAECAVKPFICEICGKRYARKSSLLSHIRQTHSTDNHELVCQTCGILYKSKVSLNAHIRTQHLGIRRIRTKYDCDVCNKSFCKPTALRRHRLIHEVHTDFVCPVCQKGFNSKFYMHVHINEVHFEKRELTKYVCQHCDAEYDTQSELNTHKSVVHTKYRCTCEICGISCSKKSELAVHMRIHTGIKPFACDECGKAFVQYSTLLVHKRSVHSTERPYSCTYCEKSFSLKGTLAKHIEGVHLKDKIEKKFICTFCSKSYLTRSGLKSHTTWHTGERNYICGICGKSFVNNSSLRKHTLIHSDEKQHECQVCSKRFHQKSNLKIHMKVHNKIPQNNVLPS